MLTANIIKTNNNKVEDIHSQVIPEGVLGSTIMKEVEQYFREQAREQGAFSDELEDAFEEGHYTGDNGTITSVDINC